MRKVDKVNVDSGHLQLCGTIQLMDSSISSLNMSAIVKQDQRA